MGKGHLGHVASRTGPGPVQCGACPHDQGLWRRGVPALAAGKFELEGDEGARLEVPQRARTSPRQADQVGGDLGDRPPPALR
jgi:hypothetical protein